MQPEIVEDSVARERRDARITTAWMLAIVATGGVLRFWGLGAGIPYNIGVDEPQVLNRAVQMMRSGDYNPHFYDYPGLYLYLQMMVACVRFMTGALLGYWSSLTEPQVHEFMLWGRALTAALGTATVLLVYRIALRWGRRQALLAAGLMAVVPLHVRESHFILTDVPLTFFIALTAVLTLRASEQPSRRTFALAGAAAGLAAATKYPGALALVLPLTALFGTAELRGVRLTTALGVVAASGVAFLLCAPYTLLDLPGFLNGYAWLMASYTATTPPEAPWRTYAKHLRIGMGWPAFVAALAGGGVAVIRCLRGTERLKWTLALVFPLLYFWFVSRQSLVFGRYLMPLLPFTCLLAAVAVVSAAGALRRTWRVRWAATAAVVALTSIITLPPAWDAVSFNLRHSKRSTAALAHDWILTHVPPGSTIFYEGSDLSLSHTPFRTQALPQLRLRPYEFYLQKGADYLVSSSQRYGDYLEADTPDPAARDSYLQLFALTREVARFTPDENHPGPELRVLKVMRPADQRPGR